MKSNIEIENKIKELNLEVEKWKQAQSNYNWSNLEKNRRFDKICFTSRKRIKLLTTNKASKVGIKLNTQHR